MEDIFLGILVVVLLLSPLMAALGSWRILRRKNKKFASIAILLVGIYLQVEVLLFFVFDRLAPFERSGALGLIRVPLYFLTAVTSTVFAILFAFRKFGTYIFPREKAIDYSDPATLLDAVSGILDSGHFLTALRTTLPAGKDDQQFGLDYIPFMLHTIDERRNRAVRSARLFLLATIAAASVFSVVVVYFGNLLVNEASGGTARAVVDLKSTASSIENSLRILIPKYYENQKFQTEVVPSLEKLTQLEPGAKNREIQSSIAASLNQAKTDGDFGTLHNSLIQVGSKVSKDGPQERGYAAAVEDAVGRMAKFRSAQSSAMPDVVASTGLLRATISKVEDPLNKPENHTPELIKRLGLGLVISTFFLALLRYLGNLYRTRYLQVLQAESDDFMVRRFYVALKNSSGDEKKSVLTTFMAASLGSGAGAKEALDDSPKEELAIVKELVRAASKKL